MSNNAPILTALCFGVVLCACGQPPEPLAAHDVAHGDVIAMEPASELAEVMDVLANEQGIWALATAPPFIHQWTKEGDLVRAWGGRGGAPDELIDPRALLQADSSGVWVLDSGLSLIIKMAPGGGRLRTIDLAAMDIRPSALIEVGRFGVGPSRKWVHRIDDGRWMVAITDQAVGTQIGAQFWNTTLVQIGNGNGAEPIVLKSYLGNRTDKFGTVSGYIPVPRWAVCPDQSFAVYDPVSNHILRANSSGARVDTVPLPPEQEMEITPERFAVVMAEHFRGEVAEEGVLPAVRLMWPVLSMEMANVFPEYISMHCDANSAVWIQVFDTSAPYGQGPEWLRYAGNTADRVRFPSEFTVKRIEGGLAVGLLENAFGEQQVAIYRLTEMEW